MKTWAVRKQGYHIGSVSEETEDLARCAALHLYGMTEEEIEAEGLRRAPWNRIGPDDDFEVYCFT